MARERELQTVMLWRLDPSRAFLTIGHRGKETPEKFFLIFLTFWFKSEAWNGELGRKTGNYLVRMTSQNL